MKDRTPLVGIFAVVIVAITSAFVMGMNWWLSDKLADASWCARAINAEKLTAGRANSAFETCQELLMKQIGSLALNSHIFAFIIALCLLVLIVIVIAGAKLALKVSKDGADVDMGRDPLAMPAVTTTTTTKIEGEA